MLAKKSQMKIHGAVREYIAKWGYEYSQFLQYLDIKRSVLKNDWAELKDAHLIQRELYSIPERLYMMITLKLDEKEAVEMTKKDSAEWFAKTFPQFKVTKEI
jgi:hypothetical protein